MTSPDNALPDAMLRIERALLAALCQASLDAEIRTTIVQKLAKHRFADADHEVVFRALVTIPSLGQNDMLAALTQAVTRMGFPDIEPRDYFKEELPGNEELLRLVTQL
jgi:hypothetical protein